VEIATEQVKAEEQERIFGFIPNFYVEYDPNAAPLTTKLKFQLAATVSYDPVTLVGSDSPWQHGKRNQFFGEIQWPYTLH
jgi:hypothetical protein